MNYLDFNNVLKNKTKIITLIILIIRFAMLTCFYFHMD